MRRHLRPVALLTIALISAACQSIAYTTPNGSRLSVINFATSTDIGSLAATLPEGGSVTVKRLSQDQHADQVLSAMLQAAVAAAAK